MKNLTFLLSAFLFLFTAKASAQEPLDTAVALQYQEGQTDMNLGIGLINYYAHYHSRVPHILLSYERGLSDHISTGGFLAYASYSRYADFRYSYGYASVGGRAAYHQPLLEGVDTYAGVAAGLRLRLNSYEDPARAPFSRVGVIGAVFVGGRYHFTENLGVFAELSFGMTFVNFGISYRITAS